MAKTDQVSPTITAVILANHNLRLNKQMAMIVTRITFITLVESAGLSLLLMLGIIAITKNI